MMLRVLRRLSSIRISSRCVSSSTVNGNSPTRQTELHEIRQLMKTYNDSRVPIRTLALFEWMLNISQIKPDLICYLLVLRACNQLNDIQTSRRIHELINRDHKLTPKDYRHLQVTLMYIYAKNGNIEWAERIFEQAKNPLPDAVLFGTIFKGYNMNGQASKTIDLYEKQMMQNNTIDLDAISATCVLSACGDCQRLDLGEYVHEEILRLNLLNSPDGSLNIRLATAIMTMYCKCGSLERARRLFDEFLPAADHIAYSILMKAYLSAGEPFHVLSLFDQLRSTPIPTDSVLYLNIVHAGSELGLVKQAEMIHRSIPSSMIEKSLQLQMGLIDMHAHCSNLIEARRLFDLLKHKDASSLLHGYAIHGQGQQALQLFEQIRSESKLDAQVYRTTLRACAFSDGLVDEARHLYTTMPEQYKTPEVAAEMVSILARASRFDEVHAFIDQYESRSMIKSSTVLPLWFAYFLVCYHSANVTRAQMIYERIAVDSDDPLFFILFADLTNSSVSKDLIDRFRQQQQQQKPGVCWTEIESDDGMRHVVHEFRDTDLAHFPALAAELTVVVDELKTAGVDWQVKNGDDDLKSLFCGHTVNRLAIAQNLIATLPTSHIQLTTTRRTCRVCHEGMKQLTLLRQREILLRDSERVHHFHHGQCSCRDHF